MGDVPMNNLFKREFRPPMDRHPGGPAAPPACRHCISVGGSEKSGGETQIRVTECESRAPFIISGVELKESERPRKSWPGARNITKTGRNRAYLGRRWLADRITSYTHTNIHVSGE